MERKQPDQKAVEKWLDVPKPYVEDKMWGKKEIDPYLAGANIGGAYKAFVKEVMQFVRKDNLILDPDETNLVLKARWKEHLLLYVRPNDPLNWKTVTDKDVKKWEHKLAAFLEDED